MKKVVLALLLVFYVASMSSAANFVEVYRNKDDGYLIYIDLDTLQNKGEYVTCWSKWIPRGKELERINKMEKRKVSYFMHYSAYKLYERQDQLLQAHVYFKNGENETSHISNLAVNGWSEIVPQTVGEIVWESVKAIAGH